MPCLTNYASRLSNKNAKNSVDESARSRDGKPLFLVRLRNPKIWILPVS